MLSPVVEESPSRWAAGGAVVAAPPLGPLRLRLAAGSEHRLPSPPSPRTVGGAVAEAAGGRGRGTLCQASARAHSRYRVGGTGAGGTGIMTGGTG
jgi:hypothetical protein